MNRCCLEFYCLVVDQGKCIYRNFRLIDSVPKVYVAIDETLLNRWLVLLKSCVIYGLTACKSCYKFCAILWFHNHCFNVSDGENWLYLVIWFETLVIEWTNWGHWYLSLCLPVHLNLLIKLLLGLFGTAIYLWDIISIVTDWLTDRQTRQTYIHAYRLFVPYLVIKLTKNLQLDYANCLLWSRVFLCLPTTNTPFKWPRRWTCAAYSCLLLWIFYRGYHESLVLVCLFY